MLNKHIFSVARGMGKSEWLVDRIHEQIEKGRKCYWLGHVIGFNRMKSRYYLKFNNVCDMRMLNEEACEHNDICVFTDELLYSFLAENAEMFKYVNKLNGDWFITMAKEDFVNE